MHGKLIPAHSTIGADGSGSRVRRWSGLDVHQQKEQRFAFRRHYRVTPWAEFMELHWGTRCQLYVTPVGPEEVCVALMSRDPGLRLDEALREFLKWRAPDGRGACSSGARSQPRAASSCLRRTVALVGDASGGMGGNR
jgi:flavin-dependent dehydrogenase